MQVGITGHRGLSNEVETHVRALLADAIKEYDPAELVGVSCIADGPDSWFAEAVLSHGGRIEIVVPAGEYRQSLPAKHHAAYDELLRQASDIHETGMTTSDSQAHMTGSEILVGDQGQDRAGQTGRTRPGVVWRSATPGARARRPTGR
ncbi:hypothetical protein ACIPSA_35535 [Streptomyces sp. NPDC086549]|uniref:hypothetical protein n=1 Tax=Streptomyces sp. NPDC086549 TaxID=3365752 RepID=UPI0038108F3A